MCTASARLNTSFYRLRPGAELAGGVVDKESRERVWTFPSEFPLSEAAHRAELSGGFFISALADTDWLP